MNAARALGADLAALESDVDLLHRSSEALGLRWADTVAMRGRAEAIGLTGAVGADDPLAVVAGMPERLRVELEVLAGITEAVEAAWQGVAAVCEKLSRVAATVVDGIGDDFGTEGELDDGMAGTAAGAPEDPAAQAARAGVARIDAELGRLDGELVLIGGK